MNRRSRIAMTAEEQAEYLAKAKTIILTTIDGRGYPHSVAMWFSIIDDLVQMTTFRKSQKVVNARRNPKVALLVESGTSYGELRGLLIRATAEIIDDTELCLDILLDVNARYERQSHPELRDLLRAQATKRVALRFHPERVASWDHSKLGGAY
ncbi:MAG: pyridoxamine 5'-phosphate oxidase family protein [Candidatus Binatia bacterium]